MHVFMPPLTELDDYLDLLAAIEATASDLKIPVIVEGYPPPRDARLKMLQVTPDPGVIEVNIHPAANWNDLVEHTEFLYNAAHESYLSPEIHARWPAHRHRRRQSLRAWRCDTRRQSIPSSPRSACEPDRVLA